MAVKSNGRVVKKQREVESVAYVTALWRMSQI